MSFLQHHCASPTPSPPMLPMAECALCSVTLGPAVPPGALLGDPPPPSHTVPWALPCHIPCQDEDFTRARHTSASWLRVPRAGFTSCAEPSEAGGREHQQNPQPSFRGKETCCMTLLLNHLFLKAMFTLPLPWLGQPWILESTALTYFMQIAWSLFMYHHGVLLVEGSQITHSSSKHEEDS